MIAAVFDLDGTLFDGRVWKGIWEHHRKFHVNLPQLYFYVGFHTLPYPLFKAGLLSRETFYLWWGKHLGWTVAGMDHQTLKKMSQWLTETYIAPRIRPEIMEKLNWHKAAGHVTILLSGSYNTLAKTVARRFGFDGSIGTWLERRGNKYTGKAEPPICQGKGKVKCLELYLMSQGWDVDFGSSYAYGDSETDRFLLEKFGHPVAVYPTPELKEIALRKGWTVIPAS